MMGLMRDVVRRGLEDKHLTADLRGVSLSCPLDGDAAVARGFRSSEVSTCLGSDPSTWDFASTEILRWGVKTRSGFAVRQDEGTPSAEVVTPGQRYWLIARVGCLRIYEPVQVVAVVDEPDRKGFAYATLDGHPVSGEEAFIVERRDGGSVWFTNRSFTAPPPDKWRPFYPAALLAQPFYRRRYLKSLG